MPTAERRRRKALKAAESPQNEPEQPETPTEAPQPAPEPASLVFQDTEVDVEAPEPPTVRPDAVIQAGFQHNPLWSIVLKDEIPARTRTTKGPRKYDAAVDAAFVIAPDALLLHGLNQAAVTNLRRTYGGVRRTLPVVTSRPDIIGGELTEYVTFRMTAFSRTGPQGVKAVYLQAVPVDEAQTSSDDLDPEEDD